MSAPPASTSVLLTLGVDRDTDLRRIRDQIVRFFAARPDEAAGDRTAQQIGLVVTELAGNALRHGLPPAVVRLLGNDDCYVVEVGDQAVHDVPRPGPARTGIHSGGRGLLICLAVAEQVGWYATATTKFVWASFPRPR